jgi:hypothetical protein
MVVGSYTVKDNTFVLTFRSNLLRPSSGWLNAIHNPELNSIFLGIYAARYTETSQQIYHPSWRKNPKDHLVSDAPYTNLKTLRYC